MYPYIEIFGDKLPTYFICSSIGGVITFYLLCHMLLKRLLVHKYIKEILISSLGLLSGAKLFGFLSRFMYEYGLGNKINILQIIKNSGIVYLGGLLGYIATLYLLCRIKKKDFSEISNIIAVCIPLFHTFGRIGCYLAGCCYGKESSSVISLPYRTDFGEEFVNRIPVQLMEACFEAILFAMLFNNYKTKVNNHTECDNNLLRKYLLCYCVWRFIIEFWRGDELRGVIGIISYSQIICILLLIITIYISFEKYYKNQS